MKELSFEKKLEVEMPRTGTEKIDFEMDMIRATLMLNPENLKLSPEEMDKLVVQEYKDSLE